MHVLIVSAQFPCPPRSGFATRVYQLARHLGLSHRVTLLSYRGTDEPAVCQAGGADLHVATVTRAPSPAWAKRGAQALSLLSTRPYYSRETYSDALQRAIDELTASDRCDVIQLESSFLCGLRLPPGPRIVLDEHNIEYEVFARMARGERSIPRHVFNRVEHARFRRFERGWWRRVDGCVVTSERERDAVTGHAPHTPVTVVPNGVDLEFFAPGRSETVPWSVVFNGILTYRPNLDAALHLVNEVWPIVRARYPQATLTVVGRADRAMQRRLSGNGVEVTGEVADIRPYLERAAVVAVPVRIGGGTRLKVVEALAMGKAVVSTSLGCEGLAVRDGVHLVVADGAECFANRTMELFENACRRAMLGQAGRGLVARRYSWADAGRRLTGFYEEIRQPTDPDRLARGDPTSPGRAAHGISHRI